MSQNLFGSRSGSVVIKPASILIQRGNSNSTFTPNGFNSFGPDLSTGMVGSNTAQFTIAASDGLTVDNEISIYADLTGTQFRDWDNNIGDYSAWMTLGPNDSTPPLPQFTRGLGITGSLNVSGTGSFVNGNIRMFGDATGPNMEIGEITGLSQFPGMRYVIDTTKNNDIYSYFAIDNLAEPSGSQNFGFTSNTFNDVYPKLSSQIYGPGFNNGGNDNNTFQMYYSGSDSTAIGSGKLSILKDTYLNGSLDITGNITANSASFNYLHTIYETASIIYSSGSNQLGDELTDTQILSGSVRVQGAFYINGTQITNGTSGTSGTSGVNGSSGSSGTAGTSGTSGSSGNTGSSGTSGTSGSAGTAGTSGTSGANGGTGSSGTSGTSGANGGTGSSGTSGTSGNSGSSGSSGTAGTSGTSFASPYSGSVVITGSVAGNVNALSIASTTASLNLLNGNFFTLQLVSGSATYINPSNIVPGQTVNILLNTTGSGTVTFPTSVKQVSGSAYVPTTTTGVDVITLVSFDASSLYLASVKNLL